MPKKTVAVDVYVELDEFDIDEIIDHIEREHLTEEEKDRLFAILTQKKKQEKIDCPKIITLADKFKQQAVVEAWSRLNQVEFENRLAI